MKLNIVNIPFNAEINPLFDKRTIVELTENQMIEVDAGTGPACGQSVAVVMGVAVHAYQLGYQFGQWLAS